MPAFAFSPCHSVLPFARPARIGLWPMQCGWTAWPHSKYGLKQQPTLLTKCVRCSRSPRTKLICGLWQLSSRRVSSHGVCISMVSWLLRAFLLTLLSVLSFHKLWSLPSILSSSAEVARNKETSLMLLSKVPQEDSVPDT